MRWGFSFNPHLLHFLLFFFALFPTRPTPPPLFAGFVVAQHTLCESTTKLNLDTGSLKD